MPFVDNQAKGALNFNITMTHLYVRRKRKLDIVMTAVILYTSDTLKVFFRSITFLQAK